MEDKVIKFQELEVRIPRDENGEWAPLTLEDGRVASTIEIDCAPMTPRPDTFMRVICDKFLKCDYYDHNPCGPMSFGCWEWDVIYPSKEVRDQVGEYLKSVYNGTCPRYASW